MAFHALLASVLTKPSELNFRLKIPIVVVSLFVGAHVSRNTIPALHYYNINRESVVDYRSNRLVST